METEVHFGMVYSLPSDTKEGKERKAKRVRLQTAKKLERHWSLMRECRKFIEENSDAWERRAKWESKRIEKETRLEMQKKKKKQKYGKHDPALRKKGSRGYVESKDLGDVWNFWRQK